MSTPQTYEPVVPEAFDTPPRELARKLLGDYLVKKNRNGPTVAGRIIETESYGGIRDPASHADSGTPTPTTRPMFGQPGTAYVYQIYGMYHCLNAVARAEKRPAAVLIRAVEPVEGLLAMARGRDMQPSGQNLSNKQKKNLASGPGKLCQAFRLTTDLNGSELYSPPVVICEGQQPDEIEQTPRIGLNPETVGEAAQWPFRYISASKNRFLSR